MNVPPDLKPLGAYIKRAEELDRDEREESAVVAYYCRQYAMELGIELRENAKDAEAVTQFLLSLIEKLEEAKSKMTTSRDEGEQIVYKFAIDVFSRADAEDRAGKATKATARTFYAASVFMETLKQFGHRGEDVDEKCFYAKWKAANILKAFKEGRTPEPGPPGGIQEDMPTEESNTFPQDTETIQPQQDEDSFTSLSLPKIDSALAPATIPEYIPQNPPPSYQHLDPIPPPASTPPPASAPPPLSSPPPRPVYQQPQPHASRSPPRSPHRGGGPVLSEAQLNDALEYARFAVAALEIKDINLARQRLQGALSSIS